MERVVSTITQTNIKRILPCQPSAGVETPVSDSSKHIAQIKTKTTAGFFSQRDHIISALSLNQAWCWKSLVRPLVVSIDTFANTPLTSDLTHT